MRRAPLQPVVLPTNEDQFASIRKLQYTVNVHGYVLSSKKTLTSDMFNIKVVAELSSTPELHVYIMSLCAAELVDDDVHLDVNLKGFRGSSMIFSWTSALRPRRQNDGEWFMNTENGMHRAYAVFEAHQLQSIHILASALSIPTTSSFVSPTRCLLPSFLQHDGSTGAQELE